MLKVYNNQLDKLIEEGKIHEISLSIKIPPLNCRLFETGRMPQGNAAVCLHYACSLLLPAAEDRVQGDGNEDNDMGRNS